MTHNIQAFCQARAGSVKGKGQAGVTSTNVRFTRPSSVSHEKYPFCLLPSWLLRLIEQQRLVVMSVWPTVKPRLWEPSAPTCLTRSFMKRWPES